MKFCRCITIVLYILIEHNINSALQIGGIFEGPNQEHEIAFRVAVDLVNSQRELSHHTFTPLIANLDPENVVNEHKMVVGLTWNRPYAALETACSFLNTGIVGIFGPLSKHNANAVQSVCDAKEIPFIRTTADDEDELNCCSINLYPNLSVLARAFADLVERWDWKSFTIIYDSVDSITNVEGIFKLYNTSGHVVVIEELKKSAFGDYRGDLKKIRKSAQKNFVLLSVNENLNEILQQAQEVGLMMKKYSYIIINLDLHSIDLSLYQHSETNITSIIDPTDTNVMKVINAMQNKRTELGLQTKALDSNEVALNLETSTALIIDAVKLFAETFSDIGDYDANPLYCNTSDSWEHGSTLFNFMKLKTMNGVSGPVQFDSHGSRTDFTLHVIELTEKGLSKIGTWNSKEGLHITRPLPKDEYSSGEGSLRNASLNVMITWNEPFADYKNDSTLLVGNDQYEGFAVDFIREIALLEGFNYTLLRNIDDKNGDYDNVTNTWNGMIGDILDGTGDIAVGDITVTRKRQEYVDFTTPFMSSGIQLLYKNPAKSTPLFFAFADPFTLEVWIWISVSYFLVSVGLYVMARFCPAEWDNWDPCVQRPKYFFNQFNMRNSLWYMLGCLLQEGCDIAPRASSTRLLSGVWGFFILVIVSYYKAQLAASLTVDSFEVPFESVEDLVNNAERLGIGYGAVANEAVHTFFQQSPNKLHQKISAYMDAHPEHMVDDNYGGFLKIDGSNYAFFGESMFVQFAVGAVCYLKSVGDPINEQNFAIAMRKDAPYRSVLSRAILKLLESGKLAEIQKKWWENEKYRMDVCDESTATSIAPPLNYDHVAGIFWITIGGILLAYVLVFIELAIHIFKKCGGNFYETLKEYKAELRFYFSFKNDVKPVKNNRIVIECEEHDT